VELVDSKDLGSFVERRAGSSSVARTNLSRLLMSLLLFIWR